VSPLVTIWVVTVWSPTDEFVTVELVTVSFVIVIFPTGWYTVRLLIPALFTLSTSAFTWPIKGSENEISVVNPKFAKVKLRGLEKVKETDPEVLSPVVAIIWLAPML
jgi:hypothetical protein